MIEPSVGRVVWYYPHQDDGGTVNGQPHAATVAHVLSARLVNLGIVNENGSPYAKQGVQLLQDDDLAPTDGSGYAAWMPYQVGQAAKAENAQAASLQPVHDAISRIANDVDEKFKSLGDWLNPRLADLELKVNGSTTAPAEAPPAPAADPAADAVG